MLIISGQPTNKQLQEAWVEIRSEYAESIKTQKTTIVFDLYKKIIYTQWKMFALESLIFQLEEEFEEEAAMMLVELGFDLIENLTDRVAYLKQLEGVRIEANVLIVMLNQYVLEYEAAVNEDAVNTSGQPVELDSDKELAALSRFQGYRINKNKITVAEFIAIVNSFLDYIKNNKNGRSTI